MVDADEVRRSFALEVGRRIPVRDIEQMAYPRTKLSIDVAALLPEIDLEHLTVYGVEKAGIHYRGEVRTRMGAYPFPESIVTPSTGLYRDGALLADEADSITEDHFFWQEAHEAKLEASLSYPRRSSAGQDFVYHTSDTFVLIRALQNYLQASNGADAVLAAAMQRDANDRGLPVAPGRQYKAGLWAYSLDPETWISQMLGYGGIVVDMLPGSATSYYVSDDGQFFNDAGQFASTRAVAKLRQLETIHAYLDKTLRINHGETD